MISGIISEAQLMYDEVMKYRLSSDASVCSSTALKIHGVVLEKLKSENKENFKKILYQIVIENTGMQTNKLKSLGIQNLEKLPVYCMRVYTLNGWLKMRIDEK